MKPDELLELLDLHNREGIPVNPQVANPSVEQPPLSPTALILDDWALRKGVEVLAETESLQQLSLDAHAIADFHAAAFLPDPQRNANCADPLRSTFLEQLMDTPEYRALHESTLLRELPSRLATGAFAQQFALLQDTTTKKETLLEKQSETAREMSTLRAVGKALLDAAREVETAEEALAGVGMGPGSPGSNDVAGIAAIYRRIRGNALLQRICSLAGRFRRVAQSRQRQKVLHGSDDLVGITLSGDLSCLLVQELAKLTLPELEMDTLRRLLEKQCLSREYQTLEPVGKGPIVVVLDESGSMHGSKIETAKALALALAWIARQQRRWCGLIAYSGGGSGHRLLALPPSRWDENALVDWLVAFIGKGSSLDVPVVEMPEFFQALGAPAGKTDLLFITDGLCRIPQEVLQNFLHWKTQVQTRVISLILHNAPGDLARLSEEVHLVETLEPNSTCVWQILSL